jgi:AbrB family looped-hinge helix DNA binding protein
MTSRLVMKVSDRGQMSLPAEARHRWGMANGGTVEVFDLDGALLLVPGGSDAIRDSIRGAIRNGAYERALALMDDPDLQN